MEEDLNWIVVLCMLCDYTFFTTYDICELISTKLISTIHSCWNGGTSVVVSFQENILPPRVAYGDESMVMY